MTKAINKSLAAYQAAQEVLDEANEQLRKMKSERGRLKQEAYKLKNSLESAEQQKRKALDDLVIGKVDQSAVDQARADCEQARQALENNAETAEAYDRKVVEFEQSLPALVSKASITRRQVFGAELDGIKAEIRSMLGELPMRAWAAKVQAGGGDWNTFCVELIGGAAHPMHKRVNELQTEIEAELFGKKEAGVFKKFGKSAA